MRILYRIENIIILLKNLVCVALVSLWMIGTLYMLYLICTEQWQCVLERGEIWIKWTSYTWTILRFLFLDLRDSEALQTLLSIIRDMLELLL